MKHKKIVGVLTLVASIFLLSGCGLHTKSENTLGINFDIEGNTTDQLDYDTENPVVAMELKGYGAIVIELYPDIAPNTVSNFVSLVESGFYDGNSFHRLVPRFVLQGGDPNGDGTGGPGYTIKGEFTKNKFTNTLSHTTGIVSMARSSSYDSAGSQFFIVLSDSAKSSLDNQYAAFGKVIAGMDVIQDIEANAVVSNSSTGKLKNNITITKAIVDINGASLVELVKIES